MPSEDIAALAQECSPGATLGGGDTDDESEAPEKHCTWRIENGWLSV